MKIKYFPSLTGIRAVAAFMVVLHHTFHDAFESTYLNAVFRELNVGVNMFFVLSGFLIWYRYADNFKLNKKWIRVYFINRVARIYPVYFVLTTITMILIYVLHNKSLYDVILTYLLNLTLLNGFSSTYIYSGIPQGWTLSVEEMFYLSAPFLLTLHFRKKIGLFYLGLGILIIGILLYLFFREINFLGFFNDLKFMRITTFFGRFFEFFCGIILAKNLHKFDKFDNNIPVYTSLGSILILISIFLVFPYLQTPESSYSIQTMTGYIFNVVIFPIFVAILYFGLAKEKSTLRFFLSTRLMDVLGKSSYSLYLVHLGIIITVIFQYLPYNPLLLIVISYILSLLLWKFIEEPLNKRIRKFN